MDFDLIAWDEDDDPDGNVVHIASNGITPAEVEEILEGSGVESLSRSSDRPTKRGWTTSGKFVSVVFERVSEGGFFVIYPITAYEIEADF